MAGLLPPDAPVARKALLREVAAPGARLLLGGKVPVADGEVEGFAGLHGHPDLMARSPEFLGDLHRGPERGQLAHADREVVPAAGKDRLGIPLGLAAVLDRLGRMVAGARAAEQVLRNAP